MEMLGLFFGVARDCGMDKAFFCKAVVNVQTVRPYLGTRFHAVLGESLDCLLTWKRRRRFMRGMNRTMGKPREFLAPYIPTPNDEAFVAQMKRTRKKARQSTSRREPVCRNSGAAEAIARFSLFSLRTPLEFPT
jgi:transposase